MLVCPFENRELSGCYQKASEDGTPTMTVLMADEAATLHSVRLLIQLVDFEPRKQKHSIKMTDRGTMKLFGVQFSKHVVGREYLERNAFQ
jgi:hypothetical protein